jgi:hypothetical protein
MKKPQKLHPEESESKRASQRERVKESRPLELVNAALGLFVEKRYFATRVEEVEA